MLKQSISKSRGNQHASRLGILEMNVEREKREFEGAGIGTINKYEVQTSIKYLFYLSRAFGFEWSYKI